MISGAAIFRVVITDPNGVRRDISDRVIGSALSNLAEDTDENLLELVHSDITLTLRDHDGYFTELFSGARPGDVYDVRIDRWTGARRMKWERVFAGIPDFPWSVALEAFDRTCELQVFAYTKLLELASADGYKRSVTGRTASVSVGSKTVTVSDTTGLSPDDAFTLSSGTSNEQQVIYTVDSPTQVTVKVAFSAAFTAAPLTLDTPYYRGLTVSQHAAALFARAGISRSTVTLPENLAAIPFPSPLNIQGLPSGTPTSILEKASLITIYQGGNRYTAGSPSAGFTNAGADTAKQDWRTQLTVEPGTLQPFNATRVYDYAHPGDYYWYRTNVSGGNVQVILTKNGADVAVVDTFAYGYISDGTLRNAYLKVAPWGEVWISYVADWSAPFYDPEANLTYARTRYKTITMRCSLAGAVLTSFPDYGSLCHSAAADRMAFFPMFAAGIAEPGDPPVTALIPLTDGVRLYNHGSVSSTLARVEGLVMSTFRAFSNYFACVASDGGSAVALWNAATGELLNTYVVSSSTGGAIATTFKGALAVEEYEGFAGGRWFSVSTRATGVIPYCDCEGKTCAQALKDLAMLSAGVLQVTVFGSGRITARTLARNSGVAIALGDPLRKRGRPVWEYYRTSVGITGKDDIGGDLDLILGEKGQSARRLPLGLGMPASLALASALGAGLLAWFSVIREQLDVTVREPGQLVRLFDVVTLLGREWRVIRVESDLYGRTQALRLVEEV